MAYQVTEVQKALKGADYPMKGYQLAELARKNGADDGLVEVLRGVPQVDGPNGVMKHLSGELGGATPGGNSADQREYKDVEGPAFQVTEVQKHLSGADYPADGGQLADLAKRNGAPDDLVEVLRGLPKVDGPNAVMSKIKDHLGGRPGGS